MTLSLPVPGESTKIELSKVDDEDAEYFVETANQKSVLAGGVYESPNINGQAYVSFRKRAHFMRKYNAYGISSWIIDSLTDEWEVEKIIIPTTKQKVYIFDVETYATALVENEGYGKQCFPDITEAEVVGTGSFDFYDLQSQDEFSLEYEV